MTEKRTVELDPDNVEQMRALADVLMSGSLKIYGGSVLSALTEAVRSLLPEPPMPEPDRDCLVMDRDGDIWRDTGCGVWEGESIEHVIMYEWGDLLREYGPLTVYRPEVQR